SPAQSAEAVSAPAPAQASRQMPDPLPHSTDAVLVDGVLIEVVKVLVVAVDEEQQLVVRLERGLDLLEEVVSGGPRPDTEVPQLHKYLDAETVRLNAGACDLRGDAVNVTEDQDAVRVQVVEL